jgi:hypothetical protein
MSTLTFQIAGEFIESDEKVYFAENFDLYFYKVPVSAKTTKNITNAFHHITPTELETKAVNEREFMLYECKPDIQTIAFHLPDTDVAIPIDLVEEHITKLTRMYMQTATAGNDAIKTLLSPTEEHTVEGMDDIIAIHDTPQHEFTIEGLEGIDLDKLMIADLSGPIQSMVDFKNQLKPADVDEDDVENIVM